MVSASVALTPSDWCKSLLAGPRPLWVHRPRDGLLSSSLLSEKPDSACHTDTPLPRGSLLHLFVIIYF